MSVIVFLELQVKSDQIDELKRYLENALKDTRVFHGCHGVEVTCNQDESTNFVLVQKWETRQLYEEYVAWRDERGDLEKLVSFTSSELSMRFFEPVAL